MVRAIPVMSAMVMVLAKRSGLEQADHVIAVGRQRQA